MENLIQVQEQLKGLPLQSVMQYANGQNPQVPPYMALAELSRRKQMAQAMPVQPPQQTVADTVKQEVGTMAMMAQQQAAQQQQMQQLPQASDSGVATLPSDVHTSRFAGGGIVGFSGEDGSWVNDDNLTPEQKLLGDRQALGPLIWKWLKEHQANFEATNKRFSGAQEASPMADRVVESYGPGDPVPQTNPLAAPVQQAQPQPIAAQASAGGGAGGAGGILNLLMKAFQQPPAASPADELLKKKQAELDAQNKDFVGQGIADTKRYRDAAGVKEPEPDPGGRISALEQLQAKRNAMFEQQRAQRPTQDLMAMVNAFASGNRATKYAAPGATYLNAQKEHEAQDLSESDKNLAVQEKFASFRDAQQKYIEAYRIGDADAMKKAAEDKQKAYTELQKEVMNQSVARANAQTQAQAHIQGSAAQGLGHIAGAQIYEQGRTAGQPTKEQALLMKAYEVAEKDPGVRAFADGYKQRLAVYGPDDPQTKAMAAKLDAMVSARVRNQGQRPVATEDTGGPPPGASVLTYDRTTGTLK